MNRFAPILAVLLTAAPLFAQATAEVTGRSVTAGALAEEAPVFAAADPDAVLARAPAPGVSRQVSRLQLLRWASSLGLSPTAEDLPETLVLQRRLRSVTVQEIQDAVREALAVQEEIEPANVAVRVSSTTDLRVPSGDLKLECLCARLILNEPTRLRLRWHVRGGRSGVETVEARIVVQGEWLEAARDLEAGTLLAPGDAVERRGELPGIDSYLALNQFDERLSLMRSIKSGEPLTAGVVRSIPLVSRGDLVELRFESGGVRLRVAGRAEEPGGRGDVIAFRNVASGQRLTARIEDKQTAYVETSYGRR